MIDDSDSYISIHSNSKTLLTKGKWHDAEIHTCPVGSYFLQRFIYCKIINKRPLKIKLYESHNKSVVVVVVVMVTMMIKTQVLKVGESFS